MAFSLKNVDIDDDIFVIDWTQIKSSNHTNKYKNFIYTLPITVLENRPKKTQMKTLK